MNVMILDNKKQFHNTTLFQPFSTIKLSKWSESVCGEAIEDQPKELYFVHNCYDSGIFIVNGEITVEGNNPLKFKYQKICPVLIDRKDLSLKVSVTLFERKRLLSRKKTM